MADVKRLQDDELLAFQIYVKLVAEFLMRSPPRDATNALHSVADHAFKAADIFLSAVQARRVEANMDKEREAASSSDVEVLRKGV